MPFDARQVGLEARDVSEQQLAGEHLPPIAGEVVPA
jgi:hypothetical protein